MPVRRAELHAHPNAASCDDLLGADTAKNAQRSAAEHEQPTGEMQAVHGRQQHEEAECRAFGAEVAGRLRLLPGAGELDIKALLDALPDGLAYGVEVPLAGQRPDLDAGQRLAELVTSTRRYLKRRAA